MSGFMQQLEQSMRDVMGDMDDNDQALEKIRQEIDRAELEETKRQAKIIAECFETDAGRRCLQLLRAKTIDLPDAPSELDERDPLAFALQQARRQGMRQVMRTIEEALAYWRGEMNDNAS